MKETWQNRFDKKWSERSTFWLSRPEVKLFISQEIEKALQEQREEILRIVKELPNPADFEEWGIYQEGYEGFRKDMVFLLEDEDAVLKKLKGEL